MTQLLPVLTGVGRAAILEAQGAATFVRIAACAIGRAARLPNGAEVAMTDEIGRGPVASSSLDVAAGRLELGVYLDGSTLGLGGPETVREVGFFDQQGRLIYYWSQPDALLGAVTPQTAYALALSVTLAPADAAVIQIIDNGPPYDLLFEPALASLRRAAWRNLFLSQG